jgi:hypothetical protein
MLVAWVQEKWDRSERRGDVLRGAYSGAKAWGDTVKSILYTLLAFTLQWALFIYSADAAELNHEQAASIYALAHGQLGPAYPLPEHAPTIVLTSQQRMREIYCEGRCQANIHGMQVGNTVYVDEQLDFAQPLDASILLHELVHYLQWSRDGVAKSCEEWLSRERQAYQIQAEVLQKARVDSRSIRMLAMMLRC